MLAPPHSGQVIGSGAARRPPGLAAPTAPPKASVTTRVSGCSGWWHSKYHVREVAVVVASGCKLKMLAF